MGKNTGLFKITGNIGGVSFYDSNGENIVRISKGPSKEKILSDPEFKRTRENMKEFGGSAKTGKAFRMLFAENIKTMGESRLAGRVTGLMKRVNSLGSGERGKRSFEFTNYPEMIKGFEFNRKDPFGRMFHAPYAPISFNADRDVFTWTIPVFNTDSYIYAPEGSTHFKLILSGGILSNYSYHADSDSFEPVNSDLNLRKSLAESTIQPISGNTSSDIVLSCDLGIGAALPPEVSVIVATGIIFYQEINAQYYELASGNGMRTDAVG